MKAIRLEKGQWSFDENLPLGEEGGFGQVFRGDGPDGPVAVKRLKLNAEKSGNRELKINARLADRKQQHVVPVLDFGQDSESNRYFIVMPICEGSLYDAIQKGEIKDPTEKIEVLKSIVAGLVEAHDIIHRDLKPQNVLRYEDRWCLADFGIARFVGEATSLNTMREALTAQYAAPEQWKAEPTTGSTDVYALGCIAYVLFTGAPPFLGGTHEIRNAHLGKTPDPLCSGSPRLDALVSHMLRKSPDGRPSISRCHDVLDNITFSHTSSQTLDPLALAAKQVATASAAEEAKSAAEAARKSDRDLLAKDAASDLTAIFKRLSDLVTNSFEDHIQKKNSLEFGRAKLELGTVRQAPASSQHGLSSTSQHDVIAWAQIKLSNIFQRTDYNGASYALSASLIFSRAGIKDDFRWREVSFWSMSSTKSGSEPFSLDPSSRDFQFALGPIMHTVSIAFGPEPIDAEHEDDFIQRWSSLVARAAIGELYRPNAMPPPDTWWTEQ